MNVRPEAPGDAEAIHELNELAFAGPDEARIVDVLRASGELTLSLVAEDNGRVVGHIAFSPVEIATEGSPIEAIGLAPMAVLPWRQRQGIGSSLVRTGVDVLTRKGHRAVVVLGHPSYYPRFGFVPASRFGLRCEFPSPDEAFLAVELVRGALAAGGLVRYRSEFGGSAGRPR